MNNHLVAADSGGGNVRPALRITVAPSHASYFAGETFSVTVTFANPHVQTLSTPQTTPVVRTHKRGAHSISSAPLARPPTSPGTRLGLPSFFPGSADRTATQTRKGLIGVTPDDIATCRRQWNHSSETGRKRVFGRSLSVAVSPEDLVANLHQGLMPGTSKSPLYQSHVNDTDRATRQSMYRSSSIPLSVSQPNSRRPSLFDDQCFPSPSTVAPSSPSAFSFPATTSNSSSAYSLTLDSITETVPGSSLSSPANPSPPLGIYPSSNHSRASLRSLGHGHPPPPSPYPSHRALSPLPPPSLSAPPLTSYRATVDAGKTLILYSYAQLSGSFTLAPSVPAHSLRYELSKEARVRGGGSMDLTGSLGSSLGVERARTSHARSPSFSSSLLSLLKPSLSLPSIGSLPGPSPSHQRGRHVSTPSNSAGLGKVDVDADAPLPIFQLQSAMFTVDLELAPGEERSYTYRVTLPPNLPPTYRGKAMKFGYEFVVGTCRALPNHSTPSERSQVGKGAVSKVMRIPIRVYDHVDVGRGQQVYDLLWPVQSRTGRAVGREVHKPWVFENSASRSLPPGTVPTTGRSVGTLSEVQEYGRHLLSMCSGGTGKVERVAQAANNDEGEKEGAVQIDCRGAVEILTRNSKKVSYDVTKDGTKLAVLTFSKSAYRLGEPVLGVVEVNETGVRARVLQLSATLETHEVLPLNIAATAHEEGRRVRRVHDTHYGSFVLSTLRTTFALDIPSDGTPAFRVGVSSASDGPGKLSQDGCGGLEWKVRLRLLVAVASGDRDDVRLRGMRQDGPQGLWGTSWVASPGVVPMERATNGKAEKSQGWAAALAASLLGGEDDEDDDGEDDVAWSAARIETVECEVPINVWPGNTAFKAMDVVFDV